MREIDDRHSNQKGIACLCLHVSLALAALLPFVVPFDPPQNTDIQAYLLLISGSFGWAAYALWPKPSRTRFASFDLALVSVFILSCLVSLVVNQSKLHGLLGESFARMGLLAFLAFIGCALAYLRVRLKDLLAGLYLTVLGLALVSLPYSLVRFHTIRRLGGVFSQADWLALVLGCAIIVGISLMLARRAWRRPLILTQSFLSVVLILTETRAIIVLLVLVLIGWALRERSRVVVYSAVFLSGVAIVGALSLAQLGSHRLSDQAYAASSFRYRADLQAEALRASKHNPVWGYGQGNLTTALDCGQMTKNELIKSCRENYFFNSSHNVFLDRVLTVGWVGGLAYLGLVIRSIYLGLKSTKPFVRTAAYCILLIAGYYLTNPSSIWIELCLWVLMLQTLRIRES